MPHTSYIKYTGKGFWIPEVFLEVTCQYICEAFEQVGISTISPTLQYLYKQCDSNRIGGSYSMANISLDKLADNSTDLNELISVLELAKSTLLTIGNEISIATLNQFEDSKIDSFFKEEWGYPIYTSSIIGTIDIIVQMLHGSWTSSDYSVYYKGFPNPRNLPEI